MTSTSGIADPVQERTKERWGHESRSLAAADAVKVALLTGGGDKPYALGLASALVAQGLSLDFIGSNEVDGPSLHNSRQVNFLNLRGDQSRRTNRFNKALRVLRYYARLIRYATKAKPRIFHILWNNKFELFDRTVLMLYYRLLGRIIVLTAHNVNAGQRDSNDSLVNRLSLRVQYYLSHHVFVHTENMKKEMVGAFGVPERNVTVIPFGINNTVRNTALTSAQAKQLLGLTKTDKTILFFGNIAPYKGLDSLVAAFADLTRKDAGYRLIIAGPVKSRSRYWADVQKQIVRMAVKGRIIERVEYIPDESVELYLKAADVLILPYTHVFQSGVLFLGYSFGLPVIATDVGSLREDILEGITGFVCPPRDPRALAGTIEAYFASDLFRNLDIRRQEIRDFANKRYSWTKVGELTNQVYSRLLGT